MKISSSENHQIMKEERRKKREERTDGMQKVDSGCIFIPLPSCLERRKAS